MSKNIDPLRTILIGLGLSEKEANVYLGALTLGTCRITDLALQAGLKRTTAYSIVDSLKQKGLIAEQIKGFKKSYTASAPEMLETLHTSKLNILRQSLPLFQNLKSQENEVKSVLFLEGKEAVKSIYEELLTTSKPKDFYYAMCDVEKWRSMDPIYCDDFIRRRVKKNLNLRFLFTRSSEALNRKKLAPKLNEHVKFLPPAYELNANLVITPRRIVIHQVTSPALAVSLETQSFIGIHKVMFEMLWDGIKEI